jgi:hypothetical protein
MRAGLFFVILTFPAINPSLLVLADLSASAERAAQYAALLGAALPATADVPMTGLTHETATIAEHATAVLTGLSPAS